MMYKPLDLPDHLEPIWHEMELQFSPRITPAGLESLCGQVWRLRDARKRIDEEGEIVADAKGNAVPHPALAVEKQAQAEIRNWVVKYGVKL